MNLEGLLPLAGVFVGWFLNRLTTKAQLEATRRQRSNDQRVEAYAAWLTLSSRALYRDDADQSNSRERLEALNKLQLLESDEQLLRLITTVEDSFPVYDTAEWHEFEECNRDPNCHWEPFEKAASAVREAVRVSLKRR